MAGLSTVYRLDRIGAVIARERDRLGMFQETLAQRCGVGRTKLSLIETSKEVPTPDIVANIDRELNLRGAVCRKYCEEHCAIGAALEIDYGGDWTFTQAGIQMVTILMDQDKTKALMEQICKGSLAPDTLARLRTLSQCIQTLLVYAKLPEIERDRQRCSADGPQKIFFNEMITYLASEEKGAEAG